MSICLKFLDGFFSIGCVVMNVTCKFNNILCRILFTSLYFIIKDEKYLHRLSGISRYTETFPRKNGVPDG